MLNEDYEHYVWYQNEELDKPLIEAALTGDTAKLEEFINGPGKDPEKQKEYLRNIRFDSDGFASYFYGKKRGQDGWCLLNAAAFGGQSEMIEMLVQEVAMDVNTICYSVPPMFCCLPSMHDKYGTYTNADNRLNALETFIDLGANATLKSESGTSIVRSVCNIPNEEKKTKALKIITDKAPDACKVLDKSGRSVFSYLASSSNWKSQKILDAPTAIQLFFQVRYLAQSGAEPSEADSQFKEARFSSLGKEVTMSDQFNNHKEALIRERKSRNGSAKAPSTKPSETSAGGAKPPTVADSKTPEAGGGAKAPATEVTEALAEATIAKAANRTP